MTNNRKLRVEVWSPGVPAEHESAWQAFVRQAGARAIHCNSRWMQILRLTFGYKTYALAALEDDKIVGILPLALVKGMVFGRFLVSLPCASWAGVVADEEHVAQKLVDRAVELANELNVKNLELRHESELQHPALDQQMTSKVNMRLKLDESSDVVWKNLKSEVRTQVRKGDKQGFSLAWGNVDLLPEFYSIFSRNMRDLGTPVFGMNLFKTVLNEFQEDAELCVVRLNGKAIASALSLHDRQVTQVPWVSSLFEYRKTAANSWMYWQLIKRAVERRFRVFDFGRSTIDGPTYRFKKRWGAQSDPLVWQYYTRTGSAGDMRPDNSKYGRVKSIWRCLPVRLTQMLGPVIVRGIPA